MTSTTHTATPQLTGVGRAARALAITNLVGQIVIVFTGGWVRLTASGLGCSTWPQCEPGSFTPLFHEATSAHPYIEFGNRLVTVLLTAIGLALAIVMWQQRDRTRSVRLLGLVPLAGVAVQAIIGGITVLMDLNPAVVSLHMLVSLALVAASTYLVARCLEGDGPARLVVSRTTGQLAWVMAGIAAVMVCLGVVTTGAGPHSGDAEVGYRFALDPAHAAQAHAAAVWLFIAIQAVLAWRVLRTSPPVAVRTRHAVIVLGVVTLAQGLIGYVQYFTGLPAALVSFHLLGAAGLSAATAWYMCALRVRPAASSAQVLA